MSNNDTIFMIVLGAVGIATVSAFKNLKSIQPDIPSQLSPAGLTEFSIEMPEISVVNPGQTSMPGIDMITGLLTGISGMFQAANTAMDVKDTAEDVIDRTQEVIEDTADKGGGFIGGLWDIIGGSRVSGGDDDNTLNVSKTEALPVENPGRGWSSNPFQDIHRFVTGFPIAELTNEGAAILGLEVHSGAFPWQTPDGEGFIAPWKKTYYEPATGKVVNPADVSAALLKQVGTANAGVPPEETDVHGIPLSVIAEERENQEKINASRSARAAALIAKIRARNN